MAFSGYEARSPLFSGFSSSPVTPRRTTTPTRATPKQLTVPVGQWYSDPGALEFGSPMSSPASAATPFSPNYYRSTAFAPREGTPRRASPGISVPGGSAAVASRMSYVAPSGASGAGGSSPSAAAATAMLVRTPRKFESFVVPLGPSAASVPHTMPVRRATTPTRTGGGGSTSSSSSFYTAPSPHDAIPSSPTHMTVLPRHRQQAEESVCSSNDLSYADSGSSVSNAHIPTRRAMTPTKTMGPAYALLPQAFTTQAARRTFSPTVNRRWDAPEGSPTKIGSGRTVWKDDCDVENMNERPTPTAAMAPSASIPASPSGGSRLFLQQLVQKWSNKYQENQNSYKEGGYMAVNPGEILEQRYMVMHKLGWGEFSTVWLAYDRLARHAHQTFVAVKIAKCHTSVTESSKYEIALLKFLRNTRRSTPITQLLDSFEHRGQFGTHLCMVMPVHGSNLLCIIDQMKAKKRRRSEKEIALIKETTISVLQGLAELETLHVIHTDLKPENILSSAPDPKIVHMISSFYARNKAGITAEEQRAFELGDPTNLVCIADFGLSALLEPANTHSEAARAVGQKKEFRIAKPGVVHNMNGTLIQTREYRAPEILFGTDFCPRSDVWSLGCILFELITGDFLMDPKRKTRVEREMDVEHLAMIMQIIGPVPSRITALVRAANPPKYLSRYFNEQGQFIHAEKYRQYPRRSLALELEVFLEPAEAERAAQFIMSCFTYDPMERSHAADLLKHSWLKSTPL